LSDKQIEEIFGTYKKEFGSVPKFIKYLSETKPNFLKAYFAFRNEVMSGVIPRKYKELIILGTVASKQFYPGIKRHIEAAVNAGASKEEVLETLLLALWIGGMPSYIAGYRAIRALKKEELAALK
jgi:alkylhydroperoxidase/carboxymuconolactone decarboxylase family protein YurZ